jgi:sister chromatid cohesion protein DCC1
MQYNAPPTIHIIRSVTLSNSVLLVSPSPHIDGSENQVIIQDSLNELLDLVPAVPKLHRMNVLLKEHGWDEGHDEEGESFRAVNTGIDPILYSQWRGLERDYFLKAKRKRFTVEDAHVELQAGEQEIAQALKYSRTSIYCTYHRW